jgi:outer membrane putative beta-barrel porin/alpha-amylase
VTIPGAAAGRRTESGLGDIVASAFYGLSDERSTGLGIDLGLKVKLPTADEAKGLGTGETDYSVQADFFKPLGGALTGFGSLGYRWYGDPPGVDLRNVAYGAIGVSYRMSAETTVGAAYDYRPRITTGGSTISEVTAFWSQRMSREWKLQLYGVVGLSDGSPDAGIGALLDYRF